jgi:IS5 family transposase
LVTLLDKVTLASGSRVSADKGYSGAPNENLLKSKGLQSGIQKKASKHSPLTASAKRPHTLDLKYLS